jgi:hypothetical protein
MACLAAIAQLKQLTELQLKGNSGMTRQGLMLLTGLTKLQILGLPFSSSNVTDEDLGHFKPTWRQWAGGYAHDLQIK